MKKIYVTIVIGMLLILGTFVASGFNCKPSSGPLDVLDQFQETSDDCIWFGPFAWQEFQPVGKKHLRVEVKIKQGYEQSPPLKMTLEQPLGNVLTSVAVPATDIPSTCDWVKFDFPDAVVDVANTAFINLSFEPGGEYAWCGANGDPYPQGTSSEGLQWDWCFRTYVDKSKASPSTNPILLQLFTKTVLGQFLNNLLMRIS